MSDYFFEKEPLKKLHIYTDSSKSNSSNKVGIAFIVVDYKHSKILHKEGKQVNLKSNNRGELLAVVEALKFCYTNLSNSTIKKITIFSDSMYVVKTINKEWQARKHLDLFTEFEMIRELCPFSVSISWIKGHSGNKWNNYADELANYYRLKK